MKPVLLLIKTYTLTDHTKNSSETENTQNMWDTYKIMHTFYSLFESDL